MKMLQKRWSVKVALMADTWVWCQKSLQDYLQKFRLNVEKTINVKKIWPLTRKLRLAWIRILISEIPVQRSNQCTSNLARNIPGIIWISFIGTSKRRKKPVAKDKRGLQGRSFRPKTSVNICDLVVFPFSASYESIQASSTTEYI